MQCEMCGSEERLFKTDIEGTLLNVCKACSKFGKIISAVKEPIEEKREKKIEMIETEPEEEIIEMVVSNFQEKIRKAREKLGLNQEDFAKKIKEKESIVHKLETGEFKPSIDTAKKLEKVLHIKLIEEYKEEGKTTNIKTEELTIGDLIKIKKR